jgi:hypothetical protein
MQNDRISKKIWAKLYPKMKEEINRWSKNIDKTYVA